MQKFMASKIQTLIRLPGYKSEFGDKLEIFTGVMKTFIFCVIQYFNINIGIMY